MFKKIFISHAKEDYSHAETLYFQLKERGYQPWLDKKELLVGSNWDSEIKRKLKDSDFIVLLLSSTSVRKRGYVQKEFKYALEYSESKLIDDIYIIPILLDDCEVPSHLEKFQWRKADGNYIEEVVNSLEHQRNIYLSDLSQNEIEFPDILSEISLELNLEFPVRLNYHCSLPLFRKNRFFDSNFVNSKIQNIGYEIISDARKYFDKEFMETQTDENVYSLDISHYTVHFDTQFLSLIIRSESHFGGVHPVNVSYYLNIAFKPERTIALYDLLPGVGDFRNHLSAWITRYVTDPEQKEVQSQFVEHTELLFEMDFTFNTESLTLYFPLQRVIQCFSDLTIPLKDLDFNKKYFT